MQIPRRLNALMGLTSHVDAHDNMSKKLTALLSVIASVVTLSSMQIQNAHAHVSHVLPAQQYLDIKSGYPDIEILAAGLTGLVVVGAVFSQLFQKHRRRSLTC